MGNSTFSAQVLLATALPLILGACAQLPVPPQFTSEAIDALASTPAFSASRATVFTANDDAFDSKLELINSAQKSIDLAYYIFSDDYSTAALASALSNAAQRGVAVRMLVDYHSGYGKLDYFSMLEQRGAGNLEVRFYNRPTQALVKDAVYLTLGCGELGAAKSRCSAAKFSAIENQFSEEIIAGKAASSLGISNLNNGWSGHFLAGLYGKNPNLMALAVQKGQGVDAALLQSGPETGPKQKEQLKKLGKIYFRARYGSGLEGLRGRIEGAVAKRLYGEQVNPIYEAFTGYLPANRADNSIAQKDWAHFTDFLHHKLLLVDGERFQLGGRNVEDSYHMVPNPLARKYIFMDTDLRVERSKTASLFGSRFAKLWNFQRMVASLAEVRQHAPNDLLVNLSFQAEAEEGCQYEPESTRAECAASEFNRLQQPLNARIDAANAELYRKASIFQQQYEAQAKNSRSPIFEIDEGAKLRYFENLPFKSSNAAKGRSYGSTDGYEAASGKNIHAIWLSALADVCDVATAESPQRVLLHNAYFFLPANLLSMLGSMTDGSRDCRHVTIQVLTNSVATTDLNVVNLAAAWQLKALADHQRLNAHKPNAAQFSYHEYLPQPGDKSLSLHTKVMLFGGSAFIGSANADVRSYMMDSNNGILVQAAPQFLRAYRAWVDGLLNDSTKTVNRTALLGRDRLLIRSELIVELEKLQQRYDKKNRIDEKRRAELQQQMDELSEKIMALSESILNGDVEAHREFNSLFKAI